MEIDQQLVQDTLDYLAEQPFKNVANLITRWVKACEKPIEPEKDQETDA